MKIFSRININEYNDRLEKILETKKFSSETKNILLSMLYKIETSLNDYKKAKAERIEKSDFIERILHIIDKECDEIKVVTPKTDGSKLLEQKNKNSIIDASMGKILVYANEKDLLYALCYMDVEYNQYKNNKKNAIINFETEELYSFIATQNFFAMGMAMNISEIIRDFNGWSWNTIAKDIENIACNLIYQDILILAESGMVNKYLSPIYVNNEDRNVYEMEANSKDLSSLNKEESENDKEVDENANKQTDTQPKYNKEYLDVFKELLKKKYKSIETDKIMQNIEIILMANMTKENKNVSENLNKILQKQKEKLELMSNKKKFLSKLTEEKKHINRRIKEIDKLLNDDNLIKKEYIEINSKLENKDKIFSISHLAAKLENERKERILQIEKYNKLMEPEEYLKEKNALERKYNRTLSIVMATEKDIFEEKIIELQKQIMKCFIIEVCNAETKQEIIKLIYKLRYYCLIPVNQLQNIKDIPELQDSIKEVIDLLVDKAIDKKVLENISNSISLCYNTLKHLFETRIIELEKVHIKITKNKNETTINGKKKIEYISISLYNSKEEEIYNEKVDNLNLLNIKQNKKVELFL